jgi:hypothetical protein
VGGRIGGGEGLALGRGVAVDGTDRGELGAPAELTPVGVDRTGDGAFADCSVGAGDGTMRAAGTGVGSGVSAGVGSGVVVVGEW